MGDRDVLLPAFARSISAKVHALNHPTLTSQGRARLLESISDDIKKYSDFVQPEVSRAALERAVQLEVDLWAKGWHDQPQFDPNRQVFHREHVWPVSAVRNACVEAASERGIADTLQRMLRVAWILKEEDRVLTRLGYRSRRDDPESAYRHAQIELIARPKST